VAGLTVAAALPRLLTTRLFEISPVDPLTYSVVAAGLLAAAAVAGYLPARRVTRVDPVEALRAERRCILVLVRLSAMSPMRFSDVITDPAEFRKLMGEPPPTGLEIAARTRSPMS